MSRQGSQPIQRPDFRLRLVALMHELRVQGKDHEEVLTVGRCIDEGIRWNA